MKSKESPRGFRYIEHPTYGNHPCDEIILQESSAIGDYEDALEHPGSSFLWVSKNFHLNREEVAQLIFAMQEWLYTGNLPL